MIITFFGHSNYVTHLVHEQKALEYIEKVAGEAKVEFFLGGYGNFDSFALSCAKKYKTAHPDAKIFFITPYVTPSYEKTHLKYCAAEYDGIIFPPLESTHPKYAISHRNKWMIEQADALIAFVNRQNGGAFTAFRRARRLGKRYFNLATGEINEKSPQISAK